jgi:phage shock protein E
VNKDPATARKLIAGGATVLDVRTPEEYADGHVPSATNLPVQDVAQRIADVDKLVGGDKTKPVVVYCAKGGRAAKAKQALEAAGYTNVVNGGGFADLR